MPPSAPILTLPAAVRPRARLWTQGIGKIREGLPPAAPNGVYFLDAYVLRPLSRKGNGRQPQERFFGLPDLETRPDPYRTGITTCSTLVATLRSMRGGGSSCPEPPPTHTCRRMYRSPYLWKTSLASVSFPDWRPLVRANAPWS